MAVNVAVNREVNRAVDLSQLKRGFENPTLEAQALFRKILDAVARPGRVQDLSDAPEPPEGLSRATAGIALTLLDFETPLWLDPALRKGETQTWLRFHCGCPLVEEPAAAAFAIVADAATMPRLEQFHRGEDKYPDRSTTVIVQTGSLTQGPPVTISGPGIKTTEQVCATGLVEDFWEQMHDNGKDFQFGVDLMLTADVQLIGLPRTVQVARPQLIATSQQT